MNKHERTSSFLFAVLYVLTLSALFVQAPSLAMGMIGLGWALLLWAMGLLWLPLPHSDLRPSLAGWLLAGLRSKQVQRQGALLSRVFTQRFALLALTASLYMIFQTAAIFAPPPLGPGHEVMEKIHAVLQSQNLSVPIIEDLSQADLLLLVRLLTVCAAMIVAMGLALHASIATGLRLFSCGVFLAILLYAAFAGDVASGRLLPLPLWPTVIGHGVLPSGMAVLRDTGLFGGPPSGFHLRLYESGWMGTLCVYGMGLQIFALFFFQGFLQPAPGRHPRLALLILLAMLVADLLWQAGGMLDALFLAGWVALGVLWASPASRNLKEYRIRQL